jgi:hypothetical protein
VDGGRLRLLTWLWERLPAFLFLLSAGFFGGIAMAIYVPLTIVVNLRLLPPAMRPGPVRIAVMGAISAFYGRSPWCPWRWSVRRVFAG